MLKKNDIINLTITDYDYDGFGISHLFEYTIFVKEALIGEEIEALVLRVTNNNIVFAKVLNIIKKSPNRIEPNCSYYHLCGGCNLLHMDYQEELKFKEKTLKNTLNKMVKDIDIEPIIYNENPFNYRNKISLPIGFDGKFVVGFYQERSHNIIPSKSCLIENKNARIIIDKILQLFNESNLINQPDILRHLILRSNLNDEFMMTIVVKKDTKEIRDIIDKLDDKMVKSIYLNINSRNDNVILGDKFIHLKGDNHLLINVHNCKFKLHPNSFFQVNYHMMEKLYDKAIEFLEPTKEDVIIDAYSGTGSIGLSLSSKVKKVYGIEVVKEAVDNAKENAKINGIDNVEFILGKCENEIDNLVNKKKIDAVIMDPPRKGSDQNFLNCLIKNQIKKIIYISCSPKTLARDLAYLKENGYQIEHVVPVDMFSKTSNLETVCALTNRAGSTK